MELVAGLQRIFAKVSWIKRKVLHEHGTVMLHAVGSMKSIQEHVVTSGGTVIMVPPPSALQLETIVMHVASLAI